MSRDNAVPVVALTFQSRTIDEWLGKQGPERSTYTLAELSNGRTLSIDQDGVFDQRDVVPGLTAGKQQVHCLRWDELLAALDAVRQAGQN